MLYIRQACTHRLCGSSTAHHTWQCGVCIVKVATLTIGLKCKLMIHSQMLCTQQRTPKAQLQSEHLVRTENDTVVINFSLQILRCVLKHFRSLYYKGLLLMYMCPLTHTIARCLPVYTTSYNVNTAGTLVHELTIWRGSNHHCRSRSSRYSRGRPSTGWECRVYRWSSSSCCRSEWSWHS